MKRRKSFRNYLDFSSDLDECTFITCQNGGSCRNAIGSFYCLCPFGYTGYDCSFGQKFIISNFVF